jgi:uncharacterized membrane protein
MMEAFVSASLIAHIATGFLALLVGPVAMFSRKGGAVHRTAGKTYVGSMFVVAATAVLLAVRGADTFLLSIAVLSFYLTFGGWQAVRRRDSRGGKGTALDWTVAGATLLFGLILLVRGSGLFGGRSLFRSDC